MLHHNGDFSIFIIFQLPSGGLVLITLGYLISPIALFKQGPCYDIWWCLWSLKMDRGATSKLVADNGQIHAAKHEPRAPYVSSTLLKLQQNVFNCIKGFLKVHVMSMGTHINGLVMYNWWMGVAWKASTKQCGMHHSLQASLICSSDLFFG